MKITSTLLIALMLLCSHAYADYSTPNTTVKWSLNDLVTNSGGNVTFSSGAYLVSGIITISATDTISITEDAVVIAIEKPVMVPVITAAFAFSVTFIQTDFIMAWVNHFKVWLKDTNTIFIILEGRLSKIQENFKLIIFILREIQRFKFNIKVWI